MFRKICKGHNYLPERIMHLNLKYCIFSKDICKKMRLYSKVGHTCVFAASLESLKSGHVCSRMYLVDDINITSPATNSRCQVSKLTVEKHWISFAWGHLADLRHTVT